MIINYYYFLNCQCLCDGCEEEKVLQELRRQHSRLSTKECTCYTLMYRVSQLGRCCLRPKMVRSGLYAMEAGRLLMLKDIYDVTRGKMLQLSTSSRHVVNGDETPQYDVSLRVLHKVKLQFWTPACHHLSAVWPLHLQEKRKVCRLGSCKELIRSVQYVYCRGSQPFWHMTHLNLKPIWRHSNATIVHVNIL